MRTFSQSFGNPSSRSYAAMAIRGDVVTTPPMSNMTARMEGLLQIKSNYMEVGVPLCKVHTAKTWEDR